MKRKMELYRMYGNLERRKFKQSESETLKV